MPTYVYSDMQTGEIIELTMTMNELSSRQLEDGTILHEGRPLKRDICVEQGGRKCTNGNFPMLSDGAGVHPSQCEAAYKQSVEMGVPTQFHKETGQAIFESRSQRKAFLRAKGMYDRNGGYGD